MTTKTKTKTTTTTKKKTAATTKATKRLLTSSDAKSTLRSGHRTLIQNALDDVRAREDLRARRANDPVDFVHRFRSNADKELVALAAANLAFGNVKAIRMKVADLLERIGPSPSKAADDEASLHRALEGWKHRVFIGEDVARLLVGARRVQREDGSLGNAFARELRIADRAQPDDEHEALREALASFCDRIRVAGGLPLPRSTKMTKKAAEYHGVPFAKHVSSGFGAEPQEVTQLAPLAASASKRGSSRGEAPRTRTRRGPVNLLSNPRAGGGAKRLMLFLRWMVRPADGIDLGLWSSSSSKTQGRGDDDDESAVPAHRLLMPVDVHIHKLSRNLGFTKRKDVSWRTAVEITTALSKLSSEAAQDPTRYDFSLCHLGMLQRCPSRRDPVRCEGCGVKPVCIRWQAKPSANR